MPDVDLLALTASLIDIPSESRNEAAIADYVRDAVGPPAWDEDDTLWWVWKTTFKKDKLIRTDVRKYNKLTQAWRCW